MKYVVVILCLLCSSVCFGSASSFYWTNVTDYYFSAPHTDALKPAQNCGLKAFKDEEAVRTWYVEKYFELAKAPHLSPEDKRHKKQYLLSQVIRIAREYGRRNPYVN